MLTLLMFLVGKNLKPLPNAMGGDEVSTLQANRSLSRGEGLTPIITEELSTVSHG